jgi:sulfite reductase (NADPH) hemoprotein beta-component
MADIIDTFVKHRTADEPFIETYRRLGVTPFKEAAYLNRSKESSAAGATA